MVVWTTSLLGLLIGFSIPRQMLKCQCVTHSHVDHQETALHHHLRATQGWWRQQLLLLLFATSPSSLAYVPAGCLDEQTNCKGNNEQKKHCKRRGSDPCPPSRGSVLLIVLLNAYLRPLFCTHSGCVLSDSQFLYDILFPPISHPHSLFLSYFILVHKYPLDCHPPTCIPIAADVSIPVFYLTKSTSSYQTDKALSDTGANQKDFIGKTDSCGTTCHHEDSIPPLSPIFKHRQHHSVAAFHHSFLLVAWRNPDVLDTSSGHGAGMTRGVWEK